MIDTIHSPAALADPYGNKVTLSRNFLRIPLLNGIITDTHFAKRDRMGRLVVFLARILQDGWATPARAIAVEEGAAVLLEPDGEAKVIGSGPSYFLEAKSPPEVCRRKTSLIFSAITVHRAPSGASFNVKDWKGPGGDDYQLSAESGEIKRQGQNTEFISCCPSASLEVENYAAHKLKIVLRLAEKARAHPIAFQTS
jgi:cyanophycinase-like exopeptidase